MSSLPSVNLSALFSASGSNSGGIDVAGAVSQVLYAERAPERSWQAQQQLIDIKTAALNQLSSGASALIGRLDVLQDPVGALTGMQTSSTQPNVLGAIATSAAVAGSHLITVKNLATTASWYSTSVADAQESFAPGSYDLTVGSGSQQATKRIVLGAGINTPQQLANYINGLNLGVNASVIMDSSGARVAIVSTQSGNAGDFSLAPAPSETTSPDDFFTRAATGKDASLTVDGIPISSATNTVPGVIPGVTLNLYGRAPDSEVVLSVAPDSSRMTQAINNFVASFNNLLTQVNSQFTYDGVNRTSGPLGGDSAVRMLQSALLGIGSYSNPESSISSLRSMGIKMENDGSLTVDTAVLSRAIQSDPKAVSTFFQGTSLDGFATKLRTTVNGFANSTDGAFTVDLRSLSSQKSDLQDQIDNFERYLAGEEKRLNNEYNLANILLQQLPMQQKQIDAMLGNNTNGSGR